MPVTEPLLDKTISLGLVGCGRISKNHVEAALKLHQRISIRAICDSNPSRLKETRALIESISQEISLDLEPPLEFTSYDALLSAVKDQRINLDLVVLTTPSGLHASQAIQAASHKINVCTEKPMATRWKEGLEMVRECDKNNVYLFVVKQNRFNKTLQALKNQVNAGRFGRISMITSNVFWQRPQEYYDQSEWRGTWEFDGGALMNQASHYVDLLEWLGGPVESVYAQIATLGRTIEVEDTATLNLRWRSGAIGTMAVTMLTYPENLEGSITILGEKGSVKVGGRALNQIQEWKFQDDDAIDKEVQSLSYVCRSVYGNGHVEYYRNMVETLAGTAKPVCDGRSGLKSLELIIGAYRSARDRMPISLPLEY